LTEPEEQPSPSGQRGKTVHGELANAGHRILAPDDAEVEAYLEVALDAPSPSRAPSDPPPVAATVPEPGVVAVLTGQLLSLGGEYLVEHLLDPVERAREVTATTQLATASFDVATQVAEAAPVPGAPTKQVAQGLPYGPALEHVLADLVDRRPDVEGCLEGIGTAVPRPVAVAVGAATASPSATASER